MRRGLALLFLAIAIGGVVLLRVLRTPEAEAPAVSDVPVATTPDAAPSPPPAELEAKKTPDALETGAAIEPGDASPARDRVAASDEIAPDAIWIEGRVAFPPGAPPEDHVEVLASASWRTKSRRFPVSADGTFRAAFPKGTERGTLDLAARFLCLASPLDVALASRGPDAPKIVLSPKVGGCLRGRIVLPSNALDRRARVVGSDVWLTATLEADGWSFGDQIHRSARVADDLTFELGGVPEGAARIWVNARPPGFASVSVENARAHAGLVTEVELRPMLGARVAGRVVDEQGSPLANVRVNTSTVKSRGRMRAGGKKIGADGTFAIEGIEPGKLTLEAQSAGLAFASLEVGELADGDVREGLEIVLPLGDPVRGRVQWPDGSAAAGCGIEYAATEATDERRLDFGDGNPSATAASDGTFEIVGLGKSAVQLTAKLRAPDPGPLAGQTGVARVEDVRPGTSDLVIVLALGRSARGRAVDDTGAPLAVFEAVAKPATGDERRPWEQDRHALRASGKDGAFAIDGLPDGAWSVTATAKGHATSAAHQVVIPTDSDPFDLVLPRSAAASGTVVDPAGKPVEGARVEIVPKGNPFEFYRRADEEPRPRTDGEGKFRLEDLAPGSQEIVASAPGFAGSEPVKLDLAPAQSVDGLVLALRRGGRIAGEVLDDTGRPDGTRSVNVDSRSSRVHIRASVDDAGRFEVSALAPGKYQMFAEPPPDRVKAASKSGEEDGFDFGMPRMAVADVVDGETTRVVIGGVPKSGIRVHGTVTAGSRPMAGCMLFAGRDALEDGNPRTATTDDQGKYEIVLDGPGKYMIAINDRKGGVSSMDRVDVPAGEDFLHDIVLPGGRISGRVIGFDGAPASNLWVQVEPDVRTAELSSSASYGTKRTDEKGAFAFDGLKAGTYALRAGVDFGGRGTRKNGMAARSGLVLAEGGSIEGLEIRLEAAARIEGVVSGPDGKPVPDATILVRDESGAPLQIASIPATDGSGHFAVEGLPAAKVFVVARTKGLVSAESPPTALKAGETARVDLALRRGTVLHVVVREKDGTPVLAAVALVDDQGRDAGYGEWYDSGSGGEDGVAATAEAGQRIGPVLPGHYKVTATNHDLASVSADVDLSGDEQTVTLKFGS